MVLRQISKPPLVMLEVPAQLNMTQQRQGCQYEHTRLSGEEEKVHWP